MAFAHTGFLLDEDEALKAALTGLTVADEQTNARSVRVRFGYGEMELTGNAPGAQVSWPFITIALLDINFERDRAHRGRIFTDATETALVDFPLPVGIDYEIVSHARSARHDRQIVSALMQGVLIPQGGVLEVDDGTVRRLDVLTGPENRDRLAGEGRREFRKAWSVRVSSELQPAAVQAVVRATTIGIEVIPLDRRDRALTDADAAAAVESEVVS